MISFKDFLLEKKKNPCWDGYKKVPGKKDYEEDSCVKEELDSASMDHKKDGRAVEELKAALLARKQEINAVKNDPDKVYEMINRLMTAVAKSHDISGQQMHDMWVDKYKEVPDTWIMESGLWDNIHAKRERIKNGSGERMRKPGSKGAPSDADFKAANEEVDQLYEVGDTAKGQKLLQKVNKRAVDRLMSKRADTDPAYAKKAQQTHWAADARLKEELSADEQFDMIEEMVMALAERHGIDSEAIWEKFEELDDTELLEAAVDAKGYKSSTGGLTQKGRDAYNRAHGSNLKAPVTTKPSKLKPGSKAANRRKSFCARMSGVDGPMKKPNGEPTRKALALRKWNC